MHRDQHGGNRQAGANHLPHESVEGVVLDIARHLPAQPQLGPEAQRPLAPALMRDGRRIVQHPVPDRSLERPRHETPQQPRRVEHDDRDHQGGNDVAKGGRGGRQHAEPGPLGGESADVDGEEQHDEDHTPVQVGRLA